MAALTALLLPSFLGWSPRTGLPPLGARSGRMAGPVARAAGAGGGMIDGVRIGPPPDMPSMLLNNRIVYLGSPIKSQVSFVPGVPQIVCVIHNQRPATGERAHRWSASLLAVRFDRAAHHHVHQLAR